MTQHNSPCNDCPFRPDIAPGYLGGAPVETYVGQLNLPFWLPCHCAPAYEGKATDVNAVSECAGAAIMRSNMGVKMPDSLLYLPSSGKAFASLAHFVAHHKGISLQEARAILTDGYVHDCMEREWNDAQVKMQLKRRKNK